MLKSNLAVRFATAFTLGPLLLAALFAGGPLVWLAVIVGASAVAASELFAMTHPGDRVAQGIGVATTALTSLGFYAGSADPRWLVTTLLVVPVVGLLVPLWRLGDIATAGMRVMAGVAAPFYIGGLLTALAVVRRDQGAAGPSWVLMALMFAWLADTGGYFFGRFLGKTPLYPAVSPKKTREGFAGSVVGACLGAALAHFWYLPSLSLPHALGLALVAGPLGQLGDLVESLVKRSTGIKDSGWVIPGHGGILDRIDALLVVSPCVYLYTVWFVGPAAR